MRSIRARSIFSSLLFSISLFGVVNIAGAQRSDIAVRGISDNNPSVRSLALGEATVALDGYVGAAHINPASIGKDGFYEAYSNFKVNEANGLLPRRDIWRGYHQYSPGISYRRGKLAGLISLSYLERKMISVDEIYLRNNAHRHLGLYLGGNYEINRGWRVGVGVNYYRLNYYQDNKLFGNLGDGKHAVSLDLGTHYRYETSLSDDWVIRPSVGLSLTDFGTMYDLPYPERSNPQFMMLRGGFNFSVITALKYFNRPLLRLTILGQGTKALVNADSQYNPDGAFAALFNSWGTFRYSSGIRYYKITPWQQVHKQIGVEVSFLNILQLRWGQYKQFWVNKYFTDRSLGLGLDLFYVAFDYARVDYNLDFYGVDYREFWQFTARIPFGKHPENFWPELLK